MFGGGDAPHQFLGKRDAAVPQRLLAAFRPAFVHDRLTRQIDDCIESLCGLPFGQAVQRVHSNAAFDRNGSRAAAEYGQFMPFGQQRLAELPPD